jgi:hypothetical protein
MNVVTADTADEMRLAVVAYFDDAINALERERAAMPPRNQRDTAMYHLRERGLKTHREFFANLQVKPNPPPDGIKRIGRNSDERR